MIIIINYGLGNLGSIVNMFKHIGVSAKVSSDKAEIKASEKLLLPGVGAFDIAMKRVHESGIKELIDHKVLVEKVPILGICLGMQLLTQGSEEGRLPGLGLINARTIRFPNKNGLKVPHMGWNTVKFFTQSELTKDLPNESKFYFVHSFYVRVDDDKNSILKSNYGITFDAAIQKGNIYGVQFHPEKSHKFGMHLLRNFASI